MAQRKVALIGAQQSPWISTRGMTPLYLCVQKEPSAELLVHLCDALGGPTEQLFISEDGHILLRPCAWAQITVLKGAASSVLCLFTTHKARAA